VDISEENMTIQEAQRLKREAENKIVDILNELERETRCEIESIHLEPAVIEETIGGLGFREVKGMNVDIRIVI
jgi:hypothetical protein